MQAYEEDYWQRYDKGETGWVSLALSHVGSGWAKLWVAGNRPVQSVTISLSYVYDPLPGLVRWMEAITRDQFPAELEINEEGEYKMLRVVSSVEGSLDLRIYNEDFPDESRRVFGMRFVKRQMVEEFVARFDYFLTHDYDLEEWCLGDYSWEELEHWRRKDLVNLDLAVLKQYLGGVWLRGGDPG